MVPTGWPITNQVNSVTASYNYDATGNVIKDEKQQVQHASWNVYGKLQEVIKADNTQIAYQYDAAGQRIAKTVADTTELYVRDASGNIMSVYKNTGSGVWIQEELHIYGCELLGIRGRQTVAPQETILPDGQAATLHTFTRGEMSYYLKNHLSSTGVIITDRKRQHSTDGQVVDYYEADIKSATYYSAYGAITKSYSEEEIKYGFNGQMRSREISVTAQTALFWEYDGDVGRRWNVDPVPKAYESPYAVFANNSIWNIDPDGADTSKLTGNKNLLIFVQDGKAEINYKKMRKQADGWDFVVVENMKGAEKLLKDYYGDKTDFIDNLVVKSHGRASTGPDLDNTARTGVVHNPAGNMQLKYVRSLLTNSANVCFTACSIIQQYNDPSHKDNKSAVQTVSNFSNFFLKGTNRNMFMNYTLSTSASYIDANKDGKLSAGESYWFNFDKGLHQQNWGGFMWFYSGNKGAMLTQKNYYQVTVETDGVFSKAGIKVNKIAPIDPKNTAPNTELPKKTNL